MTIKTINPATEDDLASYEVMSARALDEALARSATAYASYRRTNMRERQAFVSAFERELKASSAALSLLITREMGKVKKEADAEVTKCLTACAQLREQLPEWKAAREYQLSSGHAVSLEPLGPLLAIMPWNFPLWQVIRFAIPALMNGDTILLKHAPNTWGSAELIAELFQRAFPVDVFQNLRVDVEPLGRVIADARVRGVSLTGSRRAGESVGRLAGEALKPCVLELGGSDAYVVLDDADVELAARVSAESRLLNAGQSCVSAKRFIVTRKNVAAFTEAFRAELAKARHGDPLQAESTLGPLARADLRAQLHGQVLKSVSQGARLALGGVLPTGRGFFYPASLLVGVQPGHVAFEDELFGPVAAVIEAQDEADAFALANRSCYGLGGAIFSRDVARARELARTEMDAGMIFINSYVRSEAHVPFGGVKDSGVGRELGREGSFAFTNVKLVFAEP